MSSSVRSAPSISLIDAAVNGRWNEGIELAHRNRASVNATDARGYTPLVRAIQFQAPQDIPPGEDPYAGQEEFIRELLAVKADPNQSLPFQGRTPLMSATLVNKHRIVSLLLGAKADPEPVSRTGQTALMCACAQRANECARILIEGKADVNQRGAGEDTALMYAAAHANLAGARLLIENGADPLLFNSKGSFAADLMKDPELSPLLRKCRAEKVFTEEQGQVVAELFLHANRFIVRLTHGKDISFLRSTILSDQPKGSYKTLVPTEEFSLHKGANGSDDDEDPVICLLMQRKDAEGKPSDAERMMQHRGSVDTNLRLRESPYIVTNQILVTTHFNYLAYQLKWNGGDLYKWIYTNKHEPYEVLPPLVDAARGLSELHGERGVHRDVKTNNILVQQQGGRLKGAIADFDFSYIEGDRNYLYHADAHVRSISPELVYTQQCNLESPKQRRDISLDEAQANDVWAFGISCYLALCRKYPRDNTPEKDLPGILLSYRLQAGSWIDENDQELAKISPTIGKLLASATQYIWQQRPLIGRFLAAFEKELGFFLAASPTPSTPMSSSSSSSAAAAAAGPSVVESTAPASSRVPEKAASPGQMIARAQSTVNVPPARQQAGNRSQSACIVEEEAE